MVKNSFDKGPEGWCSYDYHTSFVIGGPNVFILATWQKAGGVGNSGYVWTDHRRWSIDAPEKPFSILPLLFYRGWVNADPINLVNAEVSVYLRGDDLRLAGAQCFFWVLGGNTRWHYVSHPLSISDGRWSSKPLGFVLKPDEKLWHMSWTMDPDKPTALCPILAQVESYGFSFVGFSQEIRGRLCMDEFEVRQST